MSVGLEITSEATREDIDTMVNGVMQDHKELTGGGAGDEQDASKNTPPAGNEAGDDEPAVEPGGDDSATDRTKVGGEDSAWSVTKEGQEHAWLTDEVRDEVPRWITDKELSEFSSREELDRAMGLFARAAVNASQEADDKGGKDDALDDGKTARLEPERGPDGKFRIPGTSGSDGEGDVPKPFEINLDLSEFDDGLGEKITDVLTGIRDDYEGRAKSLEERLAAIEGAARTSEQAATSARFDAAVDGLGHAELFGATGKETSEQLKQRRALYEHAEAFSGSNPSGREMTLEEATKLMFRGLFHEHISKQQHKKLTQRVTEASNMRTGVGAERPAEQEFKGPLDKHPDVRRAYKELRASRGES